MSASLVVGDLLFIGAMKAVYMLNAHTLEFLDQAPTSEWVFSLCMLDDYTLLAGQSYGYLDLLGVNSSLTKINTLLKTKFDKVSHIYALTKTSKHGEFAIGGYDGMYFGSVIEKQIGISTESYLANKTVKQIREYSPNRFLIGIDNYPAYVVIDRLATLPSEQVKDIHSNDVKTRCSFLRALVTEHPFYLGRNSGSVDVINVATGRSRALIQCELSDRHYFDSCAVVEDYGQTFKVYYAEEEGINPTNVLDRYQAALTAFGTVKCVEFDRRLIKSLVGIV